jgi:hypothetical protein
MGKDERWSVAKVGYMRPLAFALGRPILAVAALRLAGEAVRSFFYPQFDNALLKRRPVYFVDHPLDASIPFDPVRVVKYLEFVKLWMASFYRLGKAYGRRADDLLEVYVHSIRGLYADSGSIYKAAHTSTIRPAGNYSLRFALIHAADPHLNCVPSLHVLIVVANWKLASRLVAAMRSRGELLRGPDEAYLDAWLESLRREAQVITESVLFVKQHSVNCIGASLYYLRRRTPFFNEAEVEAFVSDLFAADEAGGRLPSAPALRARMLEVYRDLDANRAARPATEWRKPILDFIASFPIAQ